MQARSSAFLPSVAFRFNTLNGVFGLRAFRQVAALRGLAPKKTNRQVVAHNSSKLLRANLSASALKTSSIWSKL